MGVIGEAEPYIGKMNIYSGDYIIMMTDGVAGHMFLMKSII